MRAGLCLVGAGLALSGFSGALAQSHGGHASDDSHPQLEHWRSDRLPDKPTVPPSFSIPVEPMGFSAPGAIYLGQHFSLTSLDFLDEDRLLFTFRVPGLIHREHPKDEAEAGQERHIRAVVLELPSGAVRAEALWSVHDRGRYLWMLSDGHILVRDGDELRQGDASLDLKPYLHFPGPLLWLEIDPTQRFLVTNSREPAAQTPKPGDVPRPATAKADVVPDDELPKPANPEPELVVRILHRDSGQVMLVSRVRSVAHIPINSDGYLESLRGRGANWQINLDFFAGGATALGQVESTCSPSLEFIAQKELLATTCDHSGDHRLIAMATDGRHLWEERDNGEPIWPLLVMGSGGSRLARESLAVAHPISTYSPLGPEDVKGQLVEVFDAANGNVALAAAASPVFDAGGNVAISPSGRRVAVLSAGAIQVFDLPAPPLVPNPASQPGR